MHSGPSGLRNQNSIQPPSPRGVTSISFFLSPSKLPPLSEDQRGGGTTKELTAEPVIIFYLSLVIGTTEEP